MLKPAGNAFLVHFFLSAEGFGDYADYAGGFNQQVRLNMQYNQKLYLDKKAFFTTMKLHPLRLFFLSLLTLILWRAAVSIAQAQEPQLLWGDTHVHTSSSVDAWSYGNFSADPDTAYRYARGLPVIHPGTGQKIRLQRPLDFLVVADHAEMLQLQIKLGEGNSDWLSKSTSEELLALMSSDARDVFTQVTSIVVGGRQDILNEYHRPELLEMTWGEQIASADEHNRPGEFTALIGWEWSPGPDGANLHRVVFTASDAQTASQFIPLSYYDTVRPEGLWEWLDETSRRTGADFVAIPHNSNMSGGRMFDLRDSDGRPMTAAYINARRRWEPVIEITQTKGTSETAPSLSPNDPFADFEIRNVLLSGAIPAITEGSYARPAMLRGLLIGREAGNNPYQFGVIGSTDSHTGLVSVEESNHYGKLVQDSLPAERVDPSKGGFDPWRTSASGLAAVWAEDNTRESIMRAFKRREVYATTGPRITLRFFGGYDYVEAEARAIDLAARGYKKGVPMGGDLVASPDGQAPSFLVQVSKDPMGANLDRVQMIKGWIDDNGNAREKIFDIAWGDNRQPGENAMLSALPSTVDVDSAIYTNTTGSAQLSTVWQDPDFNSQQSAFYYLRVLEIETPRLQVYDAVALGIDPLDTGYPVTIQERAWSSPIWYTP